MRHLVDMYNMRERFIKDKIVANKRVLDTTGLFQGRPNALLLWYKVNGYDFYLPIKQWAETFDIKYTTLWSRYYYQKNKGGWDPHFILRELPKIRG